MAVTKLMESKGSLHGGDAALCIFCRIDRLFRQLERKQWLGGDPAGQFQRRRGQFGKRHHLIDHTQPICVLRRNEVGSEQHLLGLARSKLPRMPEEFDACHPHRDGVV